VLTLSAPDYIDYITAKKNHDINKWAGMYFYKVLWYQDLAIALLGQIIRHIEIQKEMTENPRRITRPKELIEIFDSETKMLSEWQEHYRKDNAVLLKEVPWERINTPPPDYPCFDLPISVLLAEDMEPSEKAEPKNS
jgi:hypothetical protein